MKTTLLILLIILSLKCYSQITKCEKEMIREVFTDLVNEYKEECSEDSTLKNKYMIEYWNGIEMDTIYSTEMEFKMESYISKIEYYEYGEPTFKGFIEWLNRDYFIRNDSIIFLKNGNYKIEGRVGGKFTIEFEY